MEDRLRINPKKIGLWTIHPFFKKSKSTSSSEKNHPLNQTFKLQRDIGNQSIISLLQSGTKLAKLFAHESTHSIRQGKTFPPDGNTIVIRKKHTISPTVQRRVSPLLDYDRIAYEIHDAIAGLGTDEEAVYLALQRLDQDPSAIRQLEITYRTRYGSSLEADIRDDFSGSELEYALQLINRGSSRSPQRLGNIPTDQSGWEAAANRIWQAVEGLGTDEEAIFSVLLPLKRNPNYIDQLKCTYLCLHNEDLTARLQDEMSGSELAYALYLMGGAPMRKRTEVQVVSMDCARQLFQELSRLTFWNDRGTQVPVPFHFPPDGCYARAQMMVERLNELGYASRKVFAVSTTPVRLRVRTDYAGNVPPSEQPRPSQKWWFHVAPIIRVRTSSGTIVDRVMDPSMANEPISIDHWTRKMSTGVFLRLTQDQLVEHLRANRGRFASNIQVTSITSKNVYMPYGPFDEGPSEAHARLEGHRSRMTGYADLAAAHELAAVIRKQLRRNTIDADLIVGAIRASSRRTRLLLWSTLPNLRVALAARLSPADMARIDAEVTRP